VNPRTTLPTREAVTLLGLLTARYDLLTNRQRLAAESLEAAVRLALREPTPEPPHPLETLLPPGSPIPGSVA